mgnify:CR=1 FL=1
MNKKINPKIIYAEITGYGKEGPWKDLAGQDLLVQSISGLSYLNGNSNQPPTPFGLSVADMFAGQHLVQGILGSLVKREIKVVSLQKNTTLRHSYSLSDSNNNN